MKGLKDSGVKVQTKRITADELGAKEIIPDLIESGTVMESDATTSAGKRDKEGEGAEDSSRTGSMNYMARQGIWEAQSTGGKIEGREKNDYFKPPEGIIGNVKGGIEVAAGCGAEARVWEKKNVYFMPGKGNAGYGKSDVGVTTRPEARAGGQKIVYSVPGQSIDDYGKGGVGVADGPGNEVGGGIEYFMSKQSVDSYGKGGAGIGVRPGAEAGAGWARKVPISCQHKARSAMGKVELVLQLDLEPK
ncbi:Transketolase-2, chloroplastic [Dirofilaria immitis]